MHKPFFASGFLYHATSQQILLQQLKKGEELKLVLFRGESSGKHHNPQTVFQRYLESALGISFPISAIHLVYDYIDDKLGEQFIFFAEVTGETPPKYSRSQAEWIPLAKLSKYKLSEQTRHDIIVGERVIRSLLEALHPPHNPPRH